MRKRRAIFFGFCVLLVMAVASRWPRLDPNEVSVTRSEVRGAQLVVEYRMSRPFEVGLGHGIRMANKSPDGLGVQVATSTALRKDKAEFVSSTYDLLRGEYYVRLCFRRGSSLSVDANGRHFEFAAWSAPDARDVKWLPPRERVRYGDGVGNDVLHIGTSSEQEEYLIVYAGTDVRRWVD